MTVTAAGVRGTGHPDPVPRSAEHLVEELQRAGAAPSSSVIAPSTNTNTFRKGRSDRFARVVRAALDDRVAGADARSDPSSTSQPRLTLKHDADIDRLAVMHRGLGARQLGIPLPED